VNDWTSGYVADIGYTYGYYPELSPLRAKLALEFNRAICPEVKTACELGFGQGVSTNYHAASSEVEWYGTDFNPVQAAFAQELGGVSDAKVNLFADSFEEFLNRDGIPEFDYIGLHGIWSWISDENRKKIVEFIDRKLKIGGVLYLSYNTFPGWATFAPMRNLMTQHADTIGAEGQGIVNRIDGALDFAQRLIKTNPLYTRANPAILERIKKIQGQNKHYLAHEYFNKDWHPMHFSQIAKMLKPAKVDFVCSAHLIDSIPNVNLSEDQRNFLAEIPDTILRESVRDFMINQQFRRDYWVKGSRKMSALERNEALFNHRFLLSQNRDDISLKISLAQGEGSLNEEIYKPILDYMSDYKIHSIRELSEGLSNAGVTPGHVLEAMMVLSTDGRVLPVNDDSIIEKVQDNCNRMNNYVINRSRSHTEMQQLLSPVAGTGIPVNRVEQFFILSLKNGITDPKQWVQEAWKILSTQGERLLKDGVAVESEEENLAVLANQASNFKEKRMHVLAALGIL